MTVKQGIPETPSIIEAIFIAGFLDEAGLYEDASLMDEFVKQASQYKDDFIKQAGLWSAIWNRLGGLTKRLFFKEYRQLYSSAKEAHKLIEERFNKAEAQFKQAKKQIKNYDLVGWRETVLNLPVYTKDLMADYEMAFGRLVAFTFKLQEKGNIPAGEFDISKITPPGEGGEGTKPEEAGKAEPEKSGPVIPIPEEWHRVDPKYNSIIQKDENNIGIRQDYYNKWKQRHFHEAQGLVKLIDHKRAYPQMLKEKLGKNTWKVLSAPGDNWVHLQKVEPEVKEVTPQEEVKEDKFPAPPGLPHIDKGPGGELKVVEPAKPAGEVSEEELKAVKEPVIRTEEDKKLYAKMMEKEKDKVWVSYRRGKGKDKFRLIDPKNVERGQTPVTDRALVTKLFDDRFLKKYKEKRRVEVYRGKADDGISKAELINTILFKK